MNLFDAIILPLGDTDAIKQNFKFRSEIVQ